MFNNDEDIEKFMELFNLDPVTKADLIHQLRINQLYSVKLKER